MILAIDIGGTEVKLGLADRQGRLYEKTAASVSFDGYKTPIPDTVLKEARRFLAQTGEKPEGVAVSACGQVDTDTGTVIGTNGKIPNYEGTCLKALMEDAFGVPAWALNDANAAALGEWFAGRARGLRDVVMITLGTGVGGGVITGGRLLGGRRGIAGELGHFTLRADGADCPCGKRGCFESYASTTALVQLCEEWSGRDGLNGKIIFDEIRHGHPLFRAALDVWIRDIAEGLTGLVHLFNPEMVLIGGGVSRQEDLLIRPLRQAVLEGCMPRFAEGLRVESASLGNDAGMIGAVRFWLDRQQEQAHRGPGPQQTESQQTECKETESQETEPRDPDPQDPVHTDFV